MKKWLRNKYNVFVHGVKLVLYKKVYKLLTYLRIYHSSDILLRANSKEGMPWNDLLLVGIKLVRADTYAVLYCKPNVGFGMEYVSLDDLICGTAILPLKESSSAIRTATESKKYPFDSGIVEIGEFKYETIEPTEPLYTTSELFTRIMDDINREFEDKKGDIYK